MSFCYDCLSKTIDNYLKYKCGGSMHKLKKYQLGGPEPDPSDYPDPESYSLAMEEYQKLNPSTNVFNENFQLTNKQYDIPLLSSKKDFKYDTLKQPPKQFTTETTRGFSPLWAKTLMGVNGALGWAANQTNENYKRNSVYNNMQNNFNPTFGGAQKDYGSKFYGKKGGLTKAKAYQWLFDEGKPTNDPDTEDTKTVADAEQERITDENLAQKQEEEQQRLRDEQDAADNELAMEQAMMSREVDEEGNPINYRTGQSNSSGFQTFATPEEGRQALVNQLGLYQSGRSRNTTGNETLAQATALYAPATENNTQAYINFVSKQLGVSPNTPIKNIDVNKWADAVTKFEGNKKGNNPGNIRKFNKGGTYYMTMAEIQELRNQGKKYKLF